MKQINSSTIKHKKRYMLSSMVKHWENNNGRFNLTLYIEVLKAKLQKNKN
jgi:hypothetical protein